MRSVSMDQVVVAQRLMKHVRCLFDYSQHQACSPYQAIAQELKLRQVTSLAAVTSSWLLPHAA